MKSLSFVLLTTLAACAGKQAEPASPDAAASTPAATAKKPASGDVAFELRATEIKASLHEPDALDRPGMPLVDPKRKTTLDKQRIAVASAKDPVEKQAQAAVLATMLYRDSRTAKDKEKDLQAEARKVLRDVAQQVGDKAIDDLTLRLLGSYELLLEDYAAAEKAWAALIAADPKSKELAINRAWLGYSLLKQNKNAEALAAVGGEKLDDKQPELAYVIAWAKFRANDAAGAWAALGTAAKGWGTNAKRDVLEQNVFLFAGRLGIAIDQALPLLQQLAKDKAAQAKTKPEPLLYDLVARVGVSGYSGGGRWADGIAAIEKAIELGGANVPPNERVVLRYTQGDFAVRLDDPEQAAKFAKLTVEATDPKNCIKCTDKERADAITGTYFNGRLFHIVFATANDKRYYQPAHDIYALTSPLLTDAGLKAQSPQDMAKLEATLKGAKPNTGTHDKGTVEALIARHTPELQACYETVLGVNPKVAGTVAISIESDATGAIKGVTTEPKAGAADLSAVAGCFAERAKAWKLPQRGMAGSTRFKAAYSLSLKK